jgi:hypothetical protein
MLYYPHAFVFCKAGKQTTIHAMLAGGTGLAYHYYQSTRNPRLCGYVLRHVSGVQLNLFGVQTQEQARAWIEALAALFDFTQPDYEDLLAQPAIRSHIERTRRLAGGRCDGPFFRRVSSSETEAPL